MSQNEIIEKLRTMMKQSSQAEVEWNNVTEESTIESLGFDSLSILDLIYDIQNEFELEFEAEEMMNIKTVGELITFLQDKMAA